LNITVMTIPGVNPELRYLQYWLLMAAWTQFGMQLKSLLAADTSKICYTCADEFQQYEGASKIFRTDAIKVINLTTKGVWKLPTSTQLGVTWHTDSLDMVVLPSTVASRYHNCCIDGATSPEYFGYILVFQICENFD
jgi:hypothetical protein